MIDKSHNDVAMHYEELATAIFGCDRMEDPWGYANANDYDAYFITPGQEAKIRLFTIIDVAIYDNQGENIVSDLLQIKSRVMNLQNQDEAIGIIHDLIDLMNANGY